MKGNIIHENITKWFEKNSNSILETGDSEMIKRLSDELNRMGLVFKDAGFNSLSKGNDCDQMAGDGGSCKEFGCLDNGGGECDDHSCANKSDGDCTNSKCTSGA